MALVVVSCAAGWLASRLHLSYSVCVPVSVPVSLSGELLPVRPAAEEEEEQCGRMYPSN